ncbi:MAG: hypothetical protein R2788_03940 [Saprospiraceae bacterium]
MACATDFTRIDAWVEKLKHWFENGLKAAFFFTHEPDNVLAARFGHLFVQQNQEKTTIKPGAKLSAIPKKVNKCLYFSAI